MVRAHPLRHLGSTGPSTLGTAVLSAGCARFGTTTGARPPLICPTVRLPKPDLLECRLAAGSLHEPSEP